MTPAPHTRWPAASRRSRLVPLLGLVLCVSPLVYALADPPPQAPGGTRAAVKQSATRASSPIPKDDWSRRVLKRLARPTPSESEQLRKQAQVALTALKDASENLPDGVIWQRRWRLDELPRRLEAKEESHTWLTALREAGPPPLEQARRAAYQATAAWFGVFSAPPQYEVQLEADVITLAAAARRDKPLTPRDDQEVRLAFRRLAQLHRADDLLGEYRAKHSHANYRTALTTDYIEAESAKQFTLPVDVRHAAGGFQIGVNGTAVAVATAEVVPNPERAEVRVDVKSTGRFTVTGRKGRMNLQAANTQTMTSSQTLYLTPAGVESPGPVVRDCSRTMLSCLSVCLRSRLIARVVETIASRIAAEKLAEQDPIVANKVEGHVREKINDEGFDIAYRINGKFGRLTSEHFPDDGDAPRLTIRSTSDDITWTALYADHDDLGSLTLAPTVPAGRFDMFSVLHESAVNSWARRLRSRYLDEATYLALLREHVKVFSPAFDVLPPLRAAAVVRFADEDPLIVRFREQGIDLTLRLSGYSTDKRTNWSSPRVVEVRYRLAPGPQGLRFVRERENFSDDAGWKAVLAHYLPPVIEPLPKFRNASFKSRLTLQYVTLGDGWLSFGANRVEQALPESEPADVVAVSAVGLAREGIARN